MKTKLRNTIVLLFVLAGMSATGQDLEQLPKQNPLEINGSISAGTGYYVTSKTFGNTRKPYSYFINAAPVISVYGIQIPINFTLTEGSQHVSNPFAQFGINPYWKWIKLYGGWTNMTWSPTTLNGKTFLGCGIEINPSLFRFGAMYGRFNPAVREDTSKFSITPQYKRRGYAFKIGVGNDKNFFDFIFLKAKDVQGSIPRVKDYLNFPAQENAVFGIISHQSFLKQKLVWDLDGSVSAYTRDQNSQLLDIGSGIGTKFLNTVIPPRLSSSYAWAAHTNLSYRAEKFSLGFDYSRIQPEYQSMGVDYILNDQQKIALTQTFNVAKNKVFLNFSESFQHDNLNKRKAVKTNRTYFNTAVTWNQSQKFNLTVSYNNFVVFQQSGIRELNDTTKLFQVQNMFSITPNITFMNEKLMHNVFIALVYQRLDDFNRFTSRFSENNTVNINIGYLISALKISFTASPSFNILYTQTPQFNMLSVGPSLSLSKTWWKGKISTSATISYIASRQNDLWNTRTITNTIGIGYQINGHHALRFNNSIMNSKFSAFETNEYKGDFTYTYTFSYILKRKGEQQKSF